jgi:predicted DNA-binding antitoxin AbrB/MazE fold protein
MVARTVITVDAMFEDGMLRPLESLPFRRNERVTLRIDVPAPEPTWPADTAEIYAELESDDRATAERMLGSVRQSWPNGAAE